MFDVNKASYDELVEYARMSSEKNENYSAVVRTGHLMQSTERMTVCHGNTPIMTWARNGTYYDVQCQFLRGKPWKR